MYQKWKSVDSINKKRTSKYIYTLYSKRAQVGDDRNLESSSHCSGAMLLTLCGEIRPWDDRAVIWIYERLALFRCTEHNLIILIQKKRVPLIKTTQMAMK